MTSPVQHARTLLRDLDAKRDREVGFADELLLFLYRLRDEYGIVGSTHPLIGGKSFSFLNNLIYSLESAPEAALRNEDSLRLIRAVLEGLAVGSIVIGPR